VIEPEGTKFLLRCVGLYLDPDDLPRCGIEVRVDFGSPSQSYDTATRGRAKVVALAATTATYEQDANDVQMTSSDLTSVTLISTPTMVVNTPDMAVVNVQFYNARRGVLLTKFDQVGNVEVDGDPILDSILILELTPIE
jgi:hypothetical protein